ncbi:type I methionyl aminopeptidase [Longimicrobium terrae]|uniref:Methionine aminopeptidase n=1 Tax=Longimicrobium terrae TaxID=1639882 RepID=A0A841GX97_9BACT|nr:type I methionyl aminopeptidase [Longimicrobium terrae]MBB4635262.1 methionyl aminopeptidase [Longimicrobium terrae]MBB6069656.1 methionyl aminopeptidase [Longimicrobium terrae]NNC31133.1 type I methionyl aminopeptidase [Longimicrobium terrae]
MSIETETELQGLRRAGHVVALTLRAMREAVREGITTGELDEVAARVMAEHGARPAPKMVYGFPGSTCISVNDEAVHGIPGARRLEKGDVVTLDVTLELDGYFSDAAITVGVAPVAETARRLIVAAEAAFHAGAKAARAGGRLSAVGAAVEAEVERRGFRVLRDLCGHGIGRAIHEEPQVVNHALRGDRTVLTDGLVIALEPVIAASTRRTRETGDGWTISTADGGLSAHFEHTIVITRGRPLLLTAA